MATYTTPTTRSSGTLITASIWNTDLVENLKYFKADPSVTTITTSGSATIGGTIVAGGSAGTSGQVLTSNGSGAAPTWQTASSGLPAVLSKSANYTVSTGDGGTVLVLCTNTITITLYAASGNAGKVVTVKNNGTGTITIDANASETIDGALTKTITAQYTSLTLVCDGTGWAII